MLTEIYIIDRLLNINKSHVIGLSCSHRSRISHNNFHEQ
jgi:hypothetical protein